MAKMAAAGVRSVRIDLGWESIQPRRGRLSPWHVRLADRCVEIARANGMSVLGTLWATPRWANGGRGRTSPPVSSADFARFARWAAGHFRGRVGAWEIWNEPDDEAFFEGSTRRYVKLLRAAYRAIKLGDRRALVVTGGTVHNNVRWLKEAYRAGAKGFFDVVATHPYQGVGDAAPETVGTGDDWWLMTHVTAVHELMARRGDGEKPIWFTEFGWSVHDNPPGIPAWRRGVSAEVQAQYVVRAIALVRARFPYVARMYWYKDRTMPDDDFHEAGYGLLRADLTPRPAYAALEALLADSAAGLAETRPAFGRWG
jgi:polysaccharide biosynthesis protein PslG